MPVLVLILATAFIGVMGVSIILPVLPRMAEHFQLTAGEIGWVITSFTLPSAIVTPISGVLADRFGRKAVMLPGLTLFALGGVGCALSRDLLELLFCRAIQGLGAAPLGIMYSTLVGDCYPEEDRPKMMGMVGATISIATAIYPMIGGLLGEYSWRFPFWCSLLAIPLTLLAIFVPLQTPEGHSNLKEYAKESSKIIFHSKAIGLFSLTFLCFCMLYGPSITYFPLLADTLYQASPSKIGTVFTLASVGTALVAINLALLNKICSKRSLMLIATACYFVAQTLILILPLYCDIFWYLVIPIFAGGAAQGLTFPILTASLTSLAHTKTRALVMAMNGTTLRLSQSFAPLFFGIGWTFLGWQGPYFMGIGVAFFIGILSIVVFKQTTSSFF